MVLATIPKNEDKRIADLLSLKLFDPIKKENFDKIIMILSKCLNVPIAYISSIETKKQRIHASCGLNFDSSDRGSSFCGHTILQSKILVVEDTLKDKRFFDNPMVIGKPKIRFYAGFPLSSASGNNIGALCVADTQPRKFNKQDREILKSIGSLLIERIRLFELKDVQQEIFDSQKELKKLNKKLSENNRFYEQLFGQYMSENLYDTIVKNKKTQLGGEQIYATVLMSDLRGFTELSDKFEPQVIVDVLNVYLEKMISIIHKHDGYINEILGDGILVIFGAPNYIENCAKRAVECAREMQEGLLLVNEQLSIQNLPNLGMGIGINSGNLIAGNIGSKKRMKYGVVGGTVNIASRVESLTLSGQILITKSTYDIIKDWVKIAGQIRVKIKGIVDPINIYDVSRFNHI
ncbi:adenylate/guanylate cyclase domain-containing protein [Aquimarina sp. AU474]|uniref:adenylate/guanylate cyclase domain-containing protein n=1 Tax=Aquimarina sp. AU474 TaxID=2108529 RepID=UPI000D6982B7|nr:adenylate/guanylate cyclase domain-containing protein [Aquimarina sp. AU474]